jgi:hypothetical protein
MRRKAMTFRMPKGLIDKLDRITESVVVINKSVIYRIALGMGLDALEQKLKKEKDEISRLRVLIPLIQADREEVDMEEGR